MMYSMIKSMLAWLCFFLLLVGIILSASSGLAQENRDGSWLLPAHYPDRFSGHGCINRIEGNEVVIDDQLYTFVADATFHTPESQLASRSGFRKRARVGFIASDNKKVESLWYIDQCR